MNEVDKLYQMILIQIGAFEHDSKKFMAGNKAAGVRSRKTSLELDRLMKLWREKTVAESKK